MSSIGSSLFGGGSSPTIPTSQLGNLDQTLTDAVSGANIMGDTQGAALLGGGASNTPSFTDIANALNNALPTSAAAAPAQQAQAAQQDPQGSTGGVQSNVSPGQNVQVPTLTPGETGPQSLQQSGSTIYGQPESPLNQILRFMHGKPPGPTWILPNSNPGQPGPQVQPTNPLQAIVSQLIGGGSQPADARLPPQPEPQGRVVTVSKPGYLDPTIRDHGPGHGAGVAPATPPPITTTEGRPDTPLPGPSGNIVAQTASYQPQSVLMHDLAGISQQGNPMALADLAAKLYGIALPLMLARGGKGGGVPGVNYGSDPAIGDLLYGGGGIPAVLRNASGERNFYFDKNGAPAPAGSFNQHGRFVGSVAKTPTSGQIPGVTAKMVDDYVRAAASKRGIDPDVASKMVGAESSWGQNNLGDKDANGNPTSFGPLQLHMAPGAMGSQFKHDTNLNPQDFAHNWQRQVDYALDKAAKGGWGPWQTSMHKLGLSKWSGINRTYAGPPATVGTDTGAILMPKGMTIG